MADVKGLYQDADGWWRFQPSSKGLPKGTKRPRVLSLGTRDQAAAISQLVRMRGLELVTGSQGGSRRLVEWVTIYLDERKRVGRHREQTSQQMERALKKLVEFLGNPFPDSVTPAAVMGFYAFMQEGRTHGTVHRYLRYTRALFYWLQERKVVTANPAARMRLPVVVQSRRDRFCTKEQRDRLLEATVERPEMRFVFMCGFYLGMRINEIVNCRWNWFQGQGGLGHCVVGSDTATPALAGFRTKTGKSRMIPLHPVFRDYLAGVERGRDEDWVLRPEKEQGKQWLRWDPRVPFNQVTAACDLDWVTPHTMRHTFGSLHAMAGTPELKIRRWMGITQQTLDRHYAGLSPDDEDAGVI